MQQELSLSEADSGATVLLVELQGGRDFRSRLAALGFTQGTQLQVLQNLGRGPMIVCLRDTRIALGRGEAQKVRVSVTSEEA